MAEAGSPHTIHRVPCGHQGDDLRRTDTRFYAQGVTFNGLREFSGAALTQIPSEEIIRIVGEVKTCTPSRDQRSGRTVR